MSSKTQYRVATCARHVGPSSVEPTEKLACCGRNPAVIKIHCQPNFALFQRAAAGAFEKPHLTGEERSLDEDVVMIVFDGV